VKPKYVLHVEGSRVCRELLTARLNCAPCLAEVIEASTLDEAHARLSEFGVADWTLVVLDLDVGGECSADLLPMLQEIPVVFVTASPERVPPGHRAIKKGRGWIPAIEKIVMGRE